MRYFTPHQGGSSSILFLEKLKNILNYSIKNTRLLTKNIGTAKQTRKKKVIRLEPWKTTSIITASNYRAAARGVNKESAACCIGDAGEYND